MSNRFFKVKLKSVLVLICLGVLGDLWGSNSTEKLDTLPAVSKADRNAEFEEGAAAWKIFLTEHIQKDIPAKRGAPVGRYFAVVRFSINTDGTVGKIEVAKGRTPDYGAGEELARVIKLSSGKWRPGLQNGKAIKVIRIQRLTFEVTSGHKGFQGEPRTRSITEIRS